MNHLYNFFQNNFFQKKTQGPNKMDNKLSCKNNLSCSFLDLFRFILDGIVNFKDFYYKQYITPNVLLTIRKKQKSNIYKLSFTQKHFYLDLNEIVTGCQLFFYLEYDPNLNTVNVIEHTYPKLNKVNFIEDKYNNYDFDKKK